MTGTIREAVNREADQPLPRFLKDPGCISRPCHPDRDNDGSRDHRHDDHIDGHTLGQRHPFGHSRGDDHDRDSGRTFLHLPSEVRSLPARAGWQWPGSSLLRDSFEHPEGRGGDRVSAGGKSRTALKPCLRPFSNSMSPLAIQLAGALGAGPGSAWFSLGNAGWRSPPLPAR